jgi:hypothetical protein
LTSTTDLCMVTGMPEAARRDGGKPVAGRAVPGFLGRPRAPGSEPSTTLGVGALVTATATEGHGGGMRGAPC